jgi:uncharacterized protein (TIGR03066 family)
MKLSRLAAQKQRQQARQAQPQSIPPTAGGLRRWRWPLLALGLVVLAGGGTLGFLHFFVWNKVPAALVGQWEVTEGPMAGGTFAFSRDGTLAIHAGAQGKDLTVNAQAVVEGKILLTISQDPQTGQEQTRTSTIRELTPTTLVLELEKGQVLRMARRK